MKSLQSTKPSILPEVQQRQLWLNCFLQIEAAGVFSSLQLVSWWRTEFSQFVLWLWSVLLAILDTQRGDALTHFTETC